VTNAGGLRAFAFAAEAKTLIDAKGQLRSISRRRYQFLCDDRMAPCTLNVVVPRNILVACDAAFAILANRTMTRVPDYHDYDPARATAISMWLPRATKVS